VVRLAGRDRVASGRRAVGEYKADVLLLDDGFQHYRVRRALDLVAVDATCPFSNGRVLPRGLLREPPEALRRADLVVLTRTDQVAPEVLDGLRKRVGPAVETVHRPVHLRQLGSKKRLELDWLKSRPFLGFCGLGNPEAFRKTLEGLGGNLVKFRAFEDHRAYDAGDARRLAAEAEEFMAEALVTTEKDATKLRAESFPLPVLALRVEIEVVRNEDLLEERLQAVVRDLPRAAAAPIGR
jgi:tetraacyldisaccharide 4'-kinase